MNRNRVDLNICKKIKQKLYHRKIRKQKFKSKQKWNKDLSIYILPNILDYFRLFI